MNVENPCQAGKTSLYSLQRRWRLCDYVRTPPGPLTRGYAARKPELGRISGAGWLAARSAPEVMRLCSNPVGTALIPAIGGTPPNGS